MRSWLSPRVGRKQKWLFKAITGIFFIDSYKFGVYYVKSYKKWTKRLKILKSPNLQWGLGLKYRDFDRNLYFSSNCNFVVIFISKDQFRAIQVKEEIKTFPNMCDTKGWGAFSHRYRLSKSVDMNSGI